MTTSSTVVTTRLRNRETPAGVEEPAAVTTDEPSHGPIRMLSRLAAPVLRPPARDLGPIPQTPGELWNLLDRVTCAETRNPPTRLASELTESLWVGHEMLGPAQWEWIHEALLRHHHPDEPRGASGKTWFWSSARVTRVTREARTLSDTDLARLQRFLQHVSRLPKSMETPSQILPMLDAIANVLEPRTAEAWLSTYWPTSNRSGIAHYYHRWDRSQQQGGRWDTTGEVLVWPEGVREAFATICRRLVRRCPEGGMLRDAFGARVLELSSGESLGIPETWKIWIDSVWERPEYHPAIQAGCTLPRVREWMQQLAVSETSGFHGALLRRPDWTSEALEHLQSKMGEEDWAYSLLQLSESGADTQPLVEAAMRDPKTDLATAACLEARWAGAGTEDSDRRRRHLLIERMNQHDGVTVLDQIASPYGGALRAALADPGIVEFLERSLVRTIVVADREGGVRIPLLGALAARRNSESPPPRPSFEERRVGE